MRIEKEVKDEVLTIKVEGRLDTNTAPELEDSVNDDIVGIKVLNIDLKNLDYISSAGLRVVLIFHKAMSASGGKLIISNPKEEVMDVFDMTGFSSFLNIEEN
jgi:anti-sigma B factor antagonist